MNRAMTLTAQPTYEEAFGSADPLIALREVVARELASGADRDRVWADLDALRVRLGRDDRETDEETVEGVMDFLWGYCSPHMRL
jgi:hypothetical protein